MRADYDDFSTPRLQLPHVGPAKLRVQSDASTPSKTPIVLKRPTKSPPIKREHRNDASSHYLVC